MTEKKPKPNYNAAGVALCLGVGLIGSAIFLWFGMAGLLFYFGLITIVVALIYGSL